MFSYNLRLYNRNYINIVASNLIASTAAIDKISRVYIKNLQKS